MNLFHRLLNRLFRTEEISGAGRCPTYLYRWALAKLFGCGVYLHHFVGDDWSRDLHDHPKRFLSIGLAGGYIEETPKGVREFKAPWIRTFPASHIHRVSLGKNLDCWTLVFVFRASRPWGFINAGRWIHWREYVMGQASHLADQRAVCSGVEGGAA